MHKGKNIMLLKLFFFFSILYKGNREKINSMVTFVIRNKSFPSW